MPHVINLTLAEWGGALRRIPRADAEAVKRAIRRTAEVDAHRWIQWSLHGGGWGDGADEPSTGRHQATEEERQAAPPKRKKRPPDMGRLLKPKPAKPKKKTAKSASSESDYRIPVDTGDYKNTFRTDIDEDGNAVVYSAATPPIKAGVIEEGRRAGKGIPIEPLTRWVERKMGLQGSAARAVAFLVSRKAAKHPRPGLHVLQRAHPKIAAALVANLRREMNEGSTPPGGG